MTYDEALAETVIGGRVRPDHWQTGIYVEHSFMRGFLKCWPVDRVEDEPIRSQQDYRPTTEDQLAVWSAIERPVLAIDASPVDAWGRSTIPAIAASLRPVDATVGWGNPLPAPKPELAVEEYNAFVKNFAASRGMREFCGECDYVKTACVCPKPDANKWGNPNKEPNKWGK